ncbi:MAG: sigma-54-dependent Fis family transcriptional regulator [Phycisphaeraceae bacterium]|nr:sigma-54-dependent Fis family transcriptional regulator [Phycisphaeraceae bacterium]
MARILLIEDETSLRIPMGKMLRRGTRPSVSHAVVECASLSEAAAAMAEGEFDLVVTDVNLPDGNGIEFVRSARSDGFDGIAVIVTAFGTIETAVAAMKQGADDFLQKPLKMEELPLQTEKWLQQRKVARRLKLYERLEQSRDEGKAIVGNSKAWQECLRLADRLATMPLTDSHAAGQQESGASLPTVLLLGETGVGKGVLARYIHQRAVAAEKARRNGSADPNDNPPFVHVNCSALPTTLVESELFGHEKGAFTDAREPKAGLFEMAEGGTIFLDEISEMPLELQTKLLVVVEQGRYRRIGGTKDKHVRARVITASNQDLDQRAADGRFRRDLLYRLNTFTVRLPPLREREGDVALIASSALATFARRYGRETPHLTDGALAALTAYRWPGNVRELVNAMQRIAMLFDGDSVDAADLGLGNLQPPMAENQGTDDGLSISRLPNGELPRAEDLERDLVKEALRKSHGNVSRAARLIGLTRAGMRYRVEQFGLAQFVKETAQQ